jgi:starch synthase
MKIFVTGTRGVPDIPGGVEQHCQQLYPLIVKRGHEVHISRRTPYVTDILTEWKGIHLHDIYTPRSKALEAIIHTFLSIIKARWINADIVHIHAIGPALMVPFARLLGLKVVFTNHGPDYDRQKWGRLSRSVLKLGEYLGGKYSNSNIVISKVIQNIVQQRCKRTSHIIYNGVSLNKTTSNTSYLKSIGVTPKGYILAVARFVPEKGLHDLIDAYANTDRKYDLVIAGDADHEDEYSNSLKKKALTCGIRLTGYITGDDLQQIYTNAALFVLPSYHEGLPIALLEALSYGLNVLVSDIPANLEVNLDSRHFFRCGDVDDLSRNLSDLLQQGVDDSYKETIREMLYKKYNWEIIALQTIDVYKTTIKTRI